jgi:hypothetical protein
MNFIACPKPTNPYPYRDPDQYRDPDEVGTPYDPLPDPGPTHFGGCECHVCRRRRGEDVRVPVAPPT